MTMEQKARAYDEDRERASKLRVQNPFDTVSQMMEYVFPELKESKDERIRKELIEQIKDNCETGFLLFQKFSPDEIIAWLEKQAGQKPADKIEPKFHEGDWVVYKNEVCQIIKREEGCNKLVTTFGIEKELVNERNLSTARLWTIDDAKEGDVLACENGWTCIFNCLNDNLFCSHCFMDNEGWFCEDGGQAHTLDNRICGEIHPATKEQRNALFAVMKVEGYEWDAKKKELKKMEQKPRWTEEDEKYIDNCCLLIGAADDCYEKPFKDDCILYLQSLKERIAWKPMPIKQKDIDDLVFDFKCSSENFKNKRVTDIYRQGIYDVMELLKQRMEQ